MHETGDKIDWDGRSQLIGHIMSISRYRASSVVFAYDLGKWALIPRHYRCGSRNNRALLDVGWCLDGFFGHICGNRMNMSRDNSRCWIFILLGFDI